MIGLFGGAGFIGRHLCARLIAAGRDVRVLDRELALDTFADHFHGIETAAMDFEDPSSYAASLDGIEVAVMLVSASVPGTFADDLAGEIVHNVLPYGRFVKAIEGHAAPGGLRRVVYLSSGGTVYGVPRQTPIAETHATRPISPYGCGKLMIEDLLGTAGRGGGFDHVVLRPANPVGPGQSGERGQGLVATILHKAARGEALTMWGDGSAVRDYFDVRDLAAAIEAVLDDPALAGETLNVGSGEGLSMLDVIDLVTRATGREVVVERRQGRGVDVPANVLDTARIRRLTGWRCEHDLTRTVAEMDEMG